eukprot:Skav225476  [mRNA]  locus=scaffold3604:205533:208818:- [translate_table: standard]
MAAVNLRLPPGEGMAALGSCAGGWSLRDVAAQLRCEPQKYKAIYDSLQKLVLSSWHDMARIKRLEMEKANKAAAALWWWQDANNAWHRWRAVEAVRESTGARAGPAAGGWCNKTAALVHIHKAGEEDCLQFALHRLWSHPSPRKALAVSSMKKRWCCNVRTAGLRQGWTGRLLLARENAIPGGLPRRESSEDRAVGVAGPRLDLVVSALGRVQPRFTLSHPAPGAEDATEQAVQIPVPSDPMVASAKG